MVGIRERKEWLTQKRSELNNTKGGGGGGGKESTRSGCYRSINEKSIKTGD